MKTLRMLWIMLALGGAPSEGASAGDEGSDKSAEAWTAECDSLKRRLTEVKARTAIYLAQFEEMEAVVALVECHLQQAKNQSADPERLTRMANTLAIAIENRRSALVTLEGMLVNQAFFASRAYEASIRAQTSARRRP